ncbi:transposase [Litorilinea aerophila]|nr:transposase [Litorilinea aerophila]MCC9079103.1 transposase [Litorilinea aerophila]
MLRLYYGGTPTRQQGQIAMTDQNDSSGKFRGKYRIPSARAAWWDYAAPGAYFITICTAGRRPFFGRVAKGEMHLSPIGEIAAQYWQEIPRHTAGHVSLDVFVVMPNHVHGIIVIHDSPVAAPVTPNTDDHPMAAISPRAGSLGAIVRSYKSAVSRWCRQNGYPEFAWQARFHDHIIRNPQEYERIAAYIVANPLNWDEDRYFHEE